MAVLTASGFVEGYDNALSQWVVRGRPVERALILAGLESGLKYDNLVAGNPLIDTIPFESARRYSASLRYIDDSKRSAYILQVRPNRSFLTPRLCITRARN